MREVAAAAWLALVVDQGTKALAHLLLAPWPETLPVLPVLDLVLVSNPGVTFGMLSGARNSAAGPWLLILLSLAVCGVLAWLARGAGGVAERWALGAVIGGALGNVLDRVRHGAVTDFLDVHYAGWHWPAFNLADVTVVCGIATYLVIGLRAPRPARPRRRPVPSQPGQVR